MMLKALKILKKKPNLALNVALVFLKLLDVIKCGALFVKLLLVNIGKIIITTQIHNPHFTDILIIIIILI